MNCLGSLAETKLLQRTTHALLEPLNDDCGKVTTVGIITADRPRLLRRCLNSFVEHCDLNGERLRFIVIDGSRSPDNGRSNRHVVADVSRITKSAVVLFGQDEYRRLLPRLAGGCIDSTPMHLLNPGETGANRNLLLLLTAGERILSVDDDIVCAPWIRDRGDRTEIRITCNTDERDIAFVKSRAMAKSMAAECGVCVLDAHNAVLGKDARHLVTAETARRALQDACQDVLAALAANERCRVAVSMSGIAGDSGMYCPYSFLFSAGTALAQLCSSEVACQTAIAHREIVAVSPRYTLNHQNYCQTYCVGLDNRSYLPPFFHVGRNQDGVFGSLLRFCEPVSLVAHVPCGVIHDSLRDSARSTSLPISATETRLADLIVMLIAHSQATIMPRGFAARLGVLASAFNVVADMHLRELIGFVKSVIVERRFRELQLIENRLSQPSLYPPHLMKRCRSYRTALIKCLSQETLFLPVECAGSVSMEDGFRLLQRRIREFAKLIDAWPILWNLWRDKHDDVFGMLAAG